MKEKDKGKEKMTMVERLLDWVGRQTGQTETEGHPYIEKAVKGLRLEEHLKRIPGVSTQLEHEYERILEGIGETIKPYAETFDQNSVIPREGVARADILDTMQQMADKETPHWQEGYVSGAVYHGEREHIDFLNRVYAMHSQTNPLHADIWPSINKYESEVIAMTVSMLNGDPECCGTLTSGGTESIMLAMKTYRDRARAEKGIKKPEMIVPVTAHAAFDKAAQYFGIKKITVGLDQQLRADQKAVKRAITRNTIVIVGSAPNFPHGIIDPIESLSELAQRKGIGFHVDACLGGFVLPWAERLGRTVPLWDFRLPGVTSISVDTHKYGYAPKGSSVVLYRSRELRHYQYYVVTDWPGGMYFSPTFAGSRSGALSAQCWAALLKMGETGYLKSTEAILKTADTIKVAIEGIDELKVLGNPLWVIAFGSDQLNIYEVMEKMGQRGWSLNGLYRPACVHLCVTLPHTQEGVAERFIEDLKAAVAEVKEAPGEAATMAPIYGMAAALPARGMVGELLKRYMDKLYQVK